ncbi:E3 SUMO-protein ligase PIAS4-like isoform X4 [Stegostoma tigrinum]|uniref:E3 SUMO-protein ligase PIAS4-like isoform X4 n=1 Tax=Stegostoma tigrinum TaxID=3053191 RepID=UPI002870493E|nr:E3 SUMO-protein ligase PIAS4-like isoform X4 [Stegostoma tigrinum]
MQGEGQRIFPESDLDFFSRMDAPMSSDHEIHSGLEEHVEVEVSVFQIEREEPEDAIIRIRLGNRLRQRRRRQRLRAARAGAERAQPLRVACPLQTIESETEQPENHTEISQLIQEEQQENLPNGHIAESSAVEDPDEQLARNREAAKLNEFERILRRRETIRLSQQRRRERLRNMSRSLEESPDPLARCRNMILGFRVSELQVLLGFAGRNKSGLKHELVSRALQLVRNNCSSEILKKIQDLHAHRYSTRSSNAQCQQLPPAPTFPLHSSEAALNARTSVPICHTGKADTKSKVRLTKLPFYEILDDLMKPTDLVPTTSERIQENQFSFTLTDKQREQIISGCSKNGAQSIQVQLRICHSDTEFIQEDQYPPYLSIKVNSRVCHFTSYFSSNKPGVEPKRPCRPIDITPLLNLTSRGANYLNIFWGHFAKRYSVVLYLVRQHVVAELLHKLQANETRASEISRELIRKKLRLEPDNDVTTTGLRVSLMCSLGKMRLSVPCRGITCTHLQCFDAALYIQMNEKKPTWMCPVCDKPAPYELLFVDQLFLDILKECEDATEVQFKDDGSWIPIKPDKQPQKNSGPQYSIVELEDTGSNQFSDPANRKGDMDVIDLTIDC